MTDKCVTCDGTRKIECYKCKGETYYTQITFSGQTEQLVQCSECKDGFIECENCIPSNLDLLIRIEKLEKTLLKALRKS